MRRSVFAVLTCAYMAASGCGSVGTSSPGSSNYQPSLVTHLGQSSTAWLATLHSASTPVLPATPQLPTSDAPAVRALLSGDFRQVTTAQLVRFREANTAAAKQSLDNVAALQGLEQQLRSETVDLRNAVASTSIKTFVSEYNRLVQLSIDNADLILRGTRLNLESEKKDALVAADLLRNAPVSQVQVIRNEVLQELRGVLTIGLQQRQRGKLQDQINGAAPKLQSLVNDPTHPEVMNFVKDVERSYPKSALSMLLPLSQ